jgi:23S rRNA (adenine2503-C2)-methyltransferase
MPEDQTTPTPTPPTAPTFLDLTVEQVRHVLTEAGEPAYRADQLADWVYAKGVTDPAKMTNLPATLKERFTFLSSQAAAKSESRDGTVKLLLKLADGETIESVLIPTARFASACLSTQVGCAMGCAFCASGRGGFKRNLSSGEILEQVLHLQQAAARHVTHVIFMGMGEPLANYDATVAAVRALADPHRFNISARRITVSTVGLPDGIRRLAREDLPITLAISLHAPNDALRSRLIPLAGQVPIAEIISAAQEFFESRRREVTLEYILLAGENDTNVCAEALVRIANQLRCSVNLIRYNPVPSLPYKRPAQEAVELFAERLQRRGVNVQIRRSRGIDTDAACGQLRRRVADAT